MNVERFEVPGLAQYSYLIADQGEAVVIDPIRDIERYTAFAAHHALRIVAILETHIHADFASGSTALAAATGAPLALSAYDAGQLYQYQMPHRALAHGDIIQCGRLKLEAIHTPGHTPEHLSFLLHESGAPTALFSGDFLFSGSLGRPDLLGDEAKLGLARDLYRSLESLASLPDTLTIYPGHGAGSFCGSGIGGHAETTLGIERATNPFFRIASESEFVATLLAAIPPMPAYYPRMKQLNAEGASVLETLPGAAALSPAEVAAHPGSIVLDLRPPDLFGAAHIPGAINIGAGSSLSLWAGWMLDPTKPILLIGNEQDPAETETRLGLIRVGLDRIAGYIAGGMSAWVNAGFPIAVTPQLTPTEAASAQAILLDVRNESEHHEGTLPHSRPAPLGTLLATAASIPHDARIITVCAGGYRSSLAASLLANDGFTDVSSLSGGIAAWTAAGLPLRG